MKKPELTETNTDAPTPRLPKRERPVKNARDARRLLSTIISEFRQGIIQGTDAKTLCYLLSTYVQIQQASELEERLVKLEQAAEKTT